MRENGRPPPRGRGARAALLALAAAAALPAAAGAQCANTVEAWVMAIDQRIQYNRLGAHDPAGMIFALEEDLVPNSNLPIGPGRARLRDGKRPRPLTLRVNAGDCLKIFFSNWLTPTAGNNQPGTRQVGIHVVGMQLLGILDDGSHVGANASSHNRSAYHFYAEKEGTYLLYSTAQNTGGDGDGGTISKGLFGAVNVEPPNSNWYRSQVTAEELALAQARDGSGNPIFTPAGQPVINYEAMYPVGHPLSGRTILRIDQADRVVHSDLNAIITNFNKGNFPAGTYDSVVVNRARHRPFREFTIIFHDEPGLVQAFDSVFNDPRFEHTLHSGRDAFAINYGTGGIGAEVLANRFGVGPMKDCTECKYEEFFLSSWVVGDPAMIVDVPADDDANNDGIPDPGGKATKALFPEDPSNVYHSYMNDHVKFRNLHAGPKEHHIFHLHAHQWLHSPNSDNSTYLDSQAIGPGNGFTYEITYDGGGNRNKTVGDAIFHCHFYPHFAQGMWGLWRVHDVFETGTVLDGNGRPAAGSRRLPDGEIAAGTPIPAVVPIPTYALAPMPTANEPGYPFFIPGVAGHRPPRPPNDVARGTGGTYLDGGLRRHVVRSGTAFTPPLNRFDFHKENLTLVVDSLGEDGTFLEVRAMFAFHNFDFKHSYRQVNGSTTVVADSFRLNGNPPVPGAPFADPCIDDSGDPVGNHTTYKAASFQLDATYNKAGWHYPQHRMFALWRDVDSVRAALKAPEPMFIRANTGDCITYSLVNLVPKEYELDDFQVRTPTDIIGQHIHLVKFDVTSSDGAANGFNYEDGSMSPGEVRERVAAIRAQNSCATNDARNGSLTCPVAVAHPFFGNGPNGEWIGAQETLQRWYVDDVKNQQGVDRTLRTVFTHDHFGPSTHQQAGLYAGLVVEPELSTWRDPESGIQFGTRDDGGPTSWRADILTADPDSSYREFNLQVNDFALAYKLGSNHTRRNFTDAATGHVTPGIADPENAINPPGRFEDALADLLQPPVRKGHCPSPVDSVANGLNVPCPELISADDPGTMTVNYRNEPVALRVQSSSGPTQASGLAGDLAHAFRSDLTRSLTALNGYGPYPQRTGVQAGDPFTPLLRAKEGDRVQIRILVGAHEEGHNFHVHTPGWLFEPSDVNSGFKSSQGMGISEHYEFVLPRLPKNYQGAEADYMYRAGSSSDDLWNGMWGILRAYVRNNTGLQNLPNNGTSAFTPANVGQFDGVCPKTAPKRNFTVTAVSAFEWLAARKLVYNARGGPLGVGPLYDSTAILYVNGRVLPNNLETKRPEPLILRARAGDCISVMLVNELPVSWNEPAGWSTLPMIVDQFNNNDLKPSTHVGLHPQSLATDVTRSDGFNVGANPVQTVAPGDSVTYTWYAGELMLRNDSIIARPVEFGALNLMPADPIRQPGKGAIGALIIEPAGWEWTTGMTENHNQVIDTSRVQAQATLYSDRILIEDRFREFVAFFQDDVNLFYGNGTPVKNLREADDPEDTGGKAINYRTEPLWFRMGHAPETNFSTTRALTTWADVLANSKIGGLDPETPVFKVEVGTPVRFRVLQPGGHARNHVFNLHGHVWQELPWTNGSTTQGNNPLSELKGTSIMHGPTNAENILLLNNAGGRFGVLGDFLLRDQASFSFDGGLWAIMRVLANGALGGN